MLRTRPGLVAVLVAVLLALLSSISLTAAAGPDVEFGSPRATGAFGERVAFSTDFRSSQPPLRVELLTRLPGSEGQRVELAEVAAAGDDRWRAAVYRAGHIVPNTRWQYRFRVVTDEGSVLGPVADHAVTDTRFEWRTIAGDRVDVWWHEGDEAFGQRALGIAEAALASAAELLGVEDMEPVDFFIYSDTRDFREAMGPATRENVGGQAHPAIRTLFGLIEPRQIDSDWIEELITHELAHLVFHEAVDNPYQYPPRWLNEGLAVYLSRGYTSADRALVEGAAGGGTIMPLEALGGNFPTRVTRSGLAYAESASAVAWFVEAYGEQRLVDLITSFAEGRGIDGAFEVATGADFASFDAAWLDSLGARPPEAYGPREVEPGPTPDAGTAEAGALLG